jgi:hypothetical protein
LLHVVIVFGVYSVRDMVGRKVGLRSKKDVSLINIDTGKFLEYRKKQLLVTAYILKGFLLSN